LKLDSKEKLIWEMSQKVKQPPIPNKDTVWERLIQEIEMYQDKTEYFIPEKRVSYWISWIDILLKRRLPLAYGLIILILSPLAYDAFFKKQVKTRPAEEKSVLLSDGTEVILNSESELTYSRNYNKNNRSVHLIGEAYFSVQKGNIPFNVLTPHGKISVLGTSFNIRARNDGFEVGVNDGEVQVSNENSLLNLSKGQLIDVKSEFFSSNIIQIPTDQYPDWLNRKFYCNETTLESLCLEIERTFDIKINFRNPNLKNLTITGVIEASDLDNVLQTVSILTKHKFKLDGGTCTIL
jgi:ferric-dicitrate binding protein FerR (iron transport regulator)